MKRFKSIVVAAFIMVIAASFATPALPASAVSSAALSIVPKKNYVIQPGKSVNDKLVIRNLDSQEPLVLTLRVVDFTFTDDGGTPKLFLAQDAPQTTWSLKPFLSVPETVTIEPKSSKSVDMSVAIPSNHGAGSYYSAIVYSSGASDGGNVGLSASGVTLVFTSIPGDVSENLKLEKLGAYHLAKNGKQGGYAFITTSKPESIAYTLKNEGNVTEAPVGSITLTDLFGRETKIDDVNPNSSLALIGQSRTFTSCIKLKAQEVDFNGQRSRSTECASPSLWPGRYSVKLNLFYGQNGNLTQEINSTASFWYLPWWFIFLVLIVLLVAGVYTLRLYRKIQTITGKRKSARSFRRR